MNFWTWLKNHNMKIAIIGGTGLLGSNLIKLFNEYDARSFSRKQSNNVPSEVNHIIDFNNLYSELCKKFISWKPDIIINTVAIVNLQKCENYYDMANNINYNIAIEIAKISKQFKSYFIHISTDHYYNDNNKTHNEKDPIILFNNYAKTKYKAEKEVMSTYDKSLIVRTNIIGFRQSSINSFFEWLLNSLEKKEKIELYTNFYTSPIAVNKLGNILINCYERNLFGIYNIASSEVINKYEFGVKVANKFGYNIENIVRIQLKKDNQNNLKRALTLGLDITKIENALNIKMPTVKETIDSLYYEYKEEIND